MCTNVIPEMTGVKGANEPSSFRGSCMHIGAHHWLWCASHS